ncbi:MAG: ArsR family transcriptional regulator [Deltaproteobacteria bacterium]|nr:ArsR family transcriptional regulator [Deltaproteobacteria bacterium]
MFVGRKKEMEKLSRLARLSKSALVVCRGRRRIGKSTLIQEFGRTVENFYEFQGLAPRRQLSNVDQLTNFSRAMAEQFKLPALTFKSWQEALALLANQTQHAPAVILLDELSWMGGRDRNFVGQLKIAWDTRFKKNPGLILVLCGSVSSWIDQNILSSADFMGRISLTISLDALSLPSCNAFWGQQKEHVSSFEKFKLLAVTGGVPRYLEEIDPTETAEQNIKAMCFDSGGILFSEFDKIFNDTFSKRATLYRKMVETLIDGPRTFSEICEHLGVDANGVISGYLADLKNSGLIAQDYAYNIKSGKRGKLSKYRVSDNYLRFYLKYIEPKRDKIEKGLYQLVNLGDLPAFETIMGLQLENLVLNNLEAVISELGIPQSSIVSASPFIQRATRRQQGCQVDLLIQTKSTLYVCEIKFRRRLDISVIHDVQRKVERLKFPRFMSIRPVLIGVGEIARGIEEEGYFAYILDLDRLLVQGG